MVVPPYDFTADPAGSDAWKLGKNFEAVSASFAVNIAVAVFFDTRDGPLSYEMPTSPTPGDAVLLKDKTGHARANSVMISTVDGSTIDGRGFLMLDQNFGSLTLVWNGDGWSVT